MGEKDIELASSIGNLMSHFPQEWQDYQDWLRDIIVSNPVLYTRYSAWQARLIFRWRLVYFVIYVFSIILGRQLQRILVNPKALDPPTLVEDKTLHTSRYHCVLQRTATLLAVAELTLCGIAAATGVMLAYYYQPTALGAHASLSMIAHDVANGTLILSLHNIAGNGLIVLALIQIVVMFLGRQFLPSWLTAWMSGICLTLCAIGLSWTAIILHWDQVGFWRFKIELSIINSLPAVGAFLREVLAGGNAINNLTLQHMYTLHSYVLAISALLLSITHLTALIVQEQSWKLRQFHLSLDQLCGDAPKRDVPSSQNR